MKRLIVFLTVFLFGGSLALAGLVLERTIPLPQVGGRIDHFAVDVAGQRLFVAALGNNTVEVVDLKAGQVVHTISGLTEPQGVFYLGELNRLYVANGGDGTLRIFDGTSFAPIGSVKFDADADNVRYDDGTKRLYVGHGGGALGVVDVVTDKIVADVPLPAHPEAFQLERNGPRVFVNVPNAHAVAVIDREQHNKVVATWPVGLAAANFPMVLDETHHRLLIACRLPARLMVFDTDTGKVAAKSDLHGDCDDLFFDASGTELYASCGEGYLEVFTRTDGDQYVRRESVPTAAKARTCSVEGDRLYLAVPKRGGGSAEIRCYRIGLNGGGTLSPAR